MRQKIDKRVVEKNFSRCANLYDEYSEIQSFAADELIKELPDHDFIRILEIGCGTGTYTRLLRERFNQARIKAVDISGSMIEAARRKLHAGGIDFITADAEEIELFEKFDLVTSNAAFQWFSDAAGTISKYENLLTDNGAMCFSTFGPLTFRELGIALEKAFCVQGPICASKFLEKKELEAVLKRCFGDIFVRERIVKRTYPSVIELLSRIKYTGSRGCGNDEKFLWLKRTVNEIEEIYRSMYGQIEATYQIFFCKALK